MNNVAYADFKSPRLEAKRVADTDDGYTRIANELLEAVMSSDLTTRQLKVFLAIVRKTYGFGKKLDRLTNTQIAEMTGIHHTHVCTAKNEMLAMNVLISKGNFLGVNKNLDDWDFNISQSSETLAKAANKTLAKAANGHSPSQLNTKETIQKKKEITPLPPSGVNLEDGLKALDHYNKISGLTCRSAEPFNKLLTATATRKAYTLDDVCLVTRWALSVWKAKGGSLPKPNNICRVTRFDGYLADAEKWQRESVDIDCKAVIDAYNEITSGKMPYAELDRERERDIRAMASKLARKNVDGFRNYFTAFMNNARDFYFGGPDGSGWCANFDTLMKPETLRKVKEGAL